MKHRFSVLVFFLFCSSLVPFSVAAQIKVTQETPPPPPKTLAASKQAVNVKAPVVTLGNTPIWLNSLFASIKDSLLFKSQQWKRSYDDAGKAKSNAMLAASRKELERYVDQKLPLVKSAPDVKNSKSYKEALQNLLEVEKQMIVKAYKPLEGGKGMNEDARKAALENLSFYTNEEKLAFERADAEQEAYLHANGIPAGGIAPDVK